MKSENAATFCRLIILALAFCPLSGAQSTYSATIVLHVARFNYIEEDNVCPDPNSPLLKKINSEMNLSFYDAMRLLQEKNAGLPAECVHAYLIEMQLTEESVRELKQQTGFTVLVAPLSFNNMVSALHKEFAKEKALPSTSKTFHFLVNCQLIRDSGDSDGHSHYRITFEVKPVDGNPEGDSFPVDLSSTEHFDQVVEKYRYVASRTLHTLCDRTVKTRLHQ